MNWSLLLFLTFLPLIIGWYFVIKPLLASELSFLNNDGETQDGRETRETRETQDGRETPIEQG